MLNLSRATVAELRAMWAKEPERITRGPNKGVATAAACKHRDAILREWKRRGFHMMDLH